MRNNSKKQLLLFFSDIKFKIFHLSLEKQILVFSCVLGVFSLFFPWVVDRDNSITWNSFNSISGNIGYILLFSYIFSLFLVFSNLYKEKIKLYISLSFNTYIIIIILGLFTLLLSIVLISFSIGLSSFGQDIFYGNGPILSMTCGILMLFSGFLIRKEFKKNNSEIILEQLSQIREESKGKNNMKLPF